MNKKEIVLEIENLKFHRDMLSIMLDTEVDPMLKMELKTELRMCLKRIRILKDSLFNDFYRLMPEKFTNVTNGIAHRRWLCQANPRLTSYLKELLGNDKFVYDADNLSKLNDYKNDKDVLNNPKIQMTPQSFKDLKASYKSVLKECSKYLKTDEKQLNDFEKSQKGIVKDIARVLYKDMKVLVECNPMEPGSLSEIISNSRSYTVHLRKSDIKKVGASLSSRIPMKKKDFSPPQQPTIMINSGWSRLTNILKY